MIDVVLPVLDEVEAIAWVLPRMPVGYRPIVVDNGSSDGSEGLARELGAIVVSASLVGVSGPPASPGCTGQSDVVCFMDCDASMDPGHLPSVGGACRGGRGGPGPRCSTGGAGSVATARPDRELVAGRGRSADGRAQP